MLEKLAQFFKGKSSLEEAVPASLEFDKTGKFSDQNLHIATAVLLVQIASADKDIAPEEAEAVCTLMEEQFGIDEKEIPGLVELAVAAGKSKAKIDDFVKLINERFDEKQRQLVLAMIWKVVLADEKIDKFEERFVTQIKFRLQLSDEQAARARQMAQHGEV